MRGVRGLGPQASRAVACSLLVGLWLAPGSSPGAEPTKTELAAARDLFARAERDEDNGRWQDALDKLRRAGSVKMTPGIRFHVALCEEKLGQLVTALGDYTAAEAAARSEGNKEVLEAVSDPLSALRARVPTLTVGLPADAKDVEVTLDGGPLAVGLVGVPVPVDVGTHTVLARTGGRPPFSSSVSLAEKQAVTVEVRFPSPVSAAGAAPTPVPPSANAHEEAAHPAGPLRAGALATTLGAVAVVGFGVGAYFVAGGKQSSAETACLGLLPSACDNFKDGVRTWDALALGAWIAGAGLAAVSVYLWTRPARVSEKGSNAELVVGLGSIRIAGEF
jgi:hypothetical protein